jgi:prepilin-type N-terminal cleavage/methylation domain-containing protein
MCHDDDLRVGVEGVDRELETSRSLFRHRHKPLHGFTLIELLVATALAAILLMSVLGVIATVQRSAAHLDTHAHQAPWRDQLVRAIQSDLTHALYFDGSEHENQAILVAHARLDERTSEPDHHPVRVRYEIRQHDETNWLVRLESDLSDDGTIQEERLLLLARSVTAFSLLEPPEPESRPGDQEQANDDDQQEQVQPQEATVPPVLMLTIAFDESVNERPISATLLLGEVRERLRDSH